MPGSSCTPRVWSAIETRLYWPAVNTTSINCWVLYCSESAPQVASERNASPCNSSAAVQQGALVVGPAVGLGALLGALDLFKRQAGRLADPPVLAEFVA